MAPDTRARTPWFPASIKPVHEGEYECFMTGIGFVRLRWDGGSFWSPNGWPAGFGAGGFERDKWRGLTEKH